MDGMAIVSELRRAIAADLHEPEAIVSAALAGVWPRE